MLTIEDRDAETQLRALIDRAAAGEEVVFTRDGKPIARLAPPANEPKGMDPKVAQAIRELEALRKTTTLGGLDWKELRDEGRR